MPDENALECGECGSVYRYRRNGRMRGPGAFVCRCGQDIFFWISDESYDYDFELIRSGWADPSDPTE